jgi:hypothetical protein
LIFKTAFKEIKNVDYFLSIAFSILIIIGILLNTLSNKTYLNDSWTIGEWLINYQGGFVRRGFLGEGIYFLCNVIKVSPIFVIWFISITSYFLLVKYTIIEAKDKVSVVFLLSPCVFLAPVIGDFLIRKDILLLLIFLFNLKILKSHNPNTFFLNILNIVGILIHESFAIYALPIQLFVFSNKLNIVKTKIIFFKFIPSILFFISCFIFKGNQSQAMLIHQSWINKSLLFPFENLNYELPLGAIDAIGWDFKDVLKILLASLTEFKGILWMPLIWLATAIFLGSFFLGDFSGKDIKIKSFVLSFQFLPFSVLCFSGWDYGRWIFIWILSSTLIYCTFGEEFKSFKCMQVILLRYDMFENFLLNLKIHKRSKILLFFFAYPHCCWSFYYLPSLLIVPIYSILQSRKSFLK